MIKIDGFEWSSWLRFNPSSYFNDEMIVLHDVVGSCLHLNVELSTENRDSCCMSVYTTHWLANNTEFDMVFGIVDENSVTVVAGQRSTVTCGMLLSFKFFLVG